MNSHPIISNGGIIVYTTPSKLYYINTKSANPTKKVTGSSLYQIYPNINDYGLLVWCANDIYLYDCSNEGAPINISNKTNSTLVFSNPKINNSGTIVWVSRDINTQECFLNIATPQVEVVRPSQLYGIFIGVKNDQTWWLCASRGDLDAERVRQAFIDNFPGINKNNLKLLEGDGDVSGVSSMQIDDAIKQLNPQPGDTLIMFISCHGSNLSGTYSLSLGQTNNIFNLYPLLQNLTSVRKEIIIDACYSHGFWDNLKQLDNVGFISSAMDNETSLYAFDGMGFLSHAIIIGLSHIPFTTYSWADLNKDKIVTFYELGEFVKMFNLPLIYDVAYEKAWGDQVTFTQDMWNPSRSKNYDTVLGLKGSNSISPILELLFID
jgi:hypothetical protein